MIYLCIYIIVVLLLFAIFGYELLVVLFLSLAEYAMELASMLDDNTQLEGWVQSKITLAQDYISKVKHYLEDELQMKSGGCGEPDMIVSGEPIYDIDDEDAYLMEN